jgi:integrase
VGPLLTIVKRRHACRRLDCALVFHRSSKGRDAQPVKDISKAWAAALKAVRLPDTLRPYDLRRSAIRNLLRAGVHERVAMEISGHRTRSTFDRYNITSTRDVADAVRRVARANR